MGGGRNPPESSATVRELVVRAGQLQADRFAAFLRIYCDARMPEQQMENFCALDTSNCRFLVKRIDLQQLSARSNSRILKVSCIIPDMTSSSSFELEHIAEAVSLNALDSPIEIASHRVKDR
jgi:predicted ATPase with chaperone activity